MASLSIVIPTLNREIPLINTINFFLRSETTHNFELVVIDQTEKHNIETEQFLAECSNRIILLKPGFKSLTRARNLGVNTSKGDIILFVDDDVIPFSGFIRAHLEAHRQEGIGVVTGPVILEGGKLASRSSLNSEEIREIFDGAGVKRNDLDFSCPARWAFGCNMSFKRSVFQKVGLFDESFQGVAWGEEYELSQRARTRGVKILYCCEAGVVHLKTPVGGCRSEVGPSYLESLVENQVYFQKNSENETSGVFQIALQFWKYMRSWVLNRNLFNNRNIFGKTIAIVVGIWRGNKRRPIVPFLSDPL